MATFTDDDKMIRKEFNNLKSYFEKLKNHFNKMILKSFKGMSGDYPIAIEVVVYDKSCSAIFGEK